MKKLFQVVIALLLIALLPLPYGLYVLINTISAAFFGFLSYRLFQEKITNAAYVCLVLTTVYQPLMRISLGRIGWCLLDAVVAASLIVFVFGHSLIKPDTRLGKSIKRLRSLFYLDESGD